MHTLSPANIHAVVEALVSHLQQAFPFISPQHSGPGHLHASKTTGFFGAGLESTADLDISELRTRRADVETRISILVARLEVVVQLTHIMEDDLRHARRNLEALIAPCHERAVRSRPITRLPDEILLRILHFALQPYEVTPFNSSNSANRVDLVCWKWRNLILSDGRFWSHFIWFSSNRENRAPEGFAKRLETAKEQLVRSAKAPLSLAVANRVNAEAYIMTSHQALFPIIQRRLKKMQLHFMDNPVIVQHVFSALERVEDLFIAERSFYDDWEDWPSFSREVGAPLVGLDPALRIARVPYPFFDTYPSLLRDVRDLNITFPQTKDPAAIRFHSLQALVSLELTRSSFTGPPQVTEFTGLEFPSLKALNLNLCADVDALLQFITDLQAPLLTSFAWTPEPPAHYWHIAQLLTDGMKIVTQKWPNLTSLSLSTRSSGEPFDLRGILRPLGNLRHFSLENRLDKSMLHLLQGIQTLGKPTAEENFWVCPRLRSLNIEIPRHPPSIFFALLDVARQRALTSDVESLHILSYKLQEVDENNKARLGLFIPEICQIIPH